MTTTKRWSTFSCLRGYDFATDKLFWSGVALVFSRPWRQLFRGGVSRGHDEQWSTVLGQSGNEAIERDGYCSRAKKDFERAVGEAVVLGAEINKVQNELLGKQ